MSLGDFLTDRNARASAERRDIYYDTLGGANEKLQRLEIAEIGGAPIKITLRGGCMPLTGAQFPSLLRGGTYTPLFSEHGFSATTGITWGPTDMAFSWEVPFFSMADHQVEGLDNPTTPEELLAVFVALQKRGRQCLVQLGALSRIGVLREIAPGPGRGYLVDPSSQSNALTSPGMNLDVTMKWDWSGEGIPGAADRIDVSVPDVRQQLAMGSSSLSSALSDSDPFAPNFLEGLSNTMGSLNASVTKLREDLNKIGSFAAAPARLANQALATARRTRGLAFDVERTLNDVAIEYQTANDSAAALFGARRAKGDANRALTDLFEAVADAIAALEKRRKRVVGVHPGDLLTTVAARELGNADRWRDLADLNAIDGQIVPPTVYSIEVQG